MSKLFFLIFFSIIATYSNAQSDTKDSLGYLLANVKYDSGKVLLLTELSNFYNESDTDTALVLALKGLEIARRIRFIKGEAVTLNAIGSRFATVGNYAEAMQYFLQSLKLNEKINNVTGLQKNFNNIGLVHFTQGDFRQALEYALKSKHLAEANEDSRPLALVLTNIGKTYMSLKILDSARIYAQRAYDVAERSYNLRMMGGALFLLGRIQFQTGHKMLALEYYRLSISLSKQEDNQLQLSQSYLAVAEVFETQDRDSAIFYARQALAISREKHFTIPLSNASSFISRFYESANLLDSAFIYQKIMVSANDSLNNKQKQTQLRGLAYDEKMRQYEIKAAALTARDERKHNLQYAALAIGLITFIILYLVLSRSIIINAKFIEFFGVLALLAVFEFINLFIHPYLADATNHSPVLMLAILIGIGAMLVPLHHKLEKWLINIMVEKNKKIRLAAARKTIATLEATN